MPWKNGEFVYSTETNAQETKNEARQIERGVTRSVDQVKETQPRSQEALQLGVVGDDPKRIQELQREITSSPIYKRIKKTPEALSIVQAIVDDTIGQGASFEYIGREDGDNDGSRAVRRSRRFWEQNQEVVGNHVAERLFIGDGYNYIRTVDDEAAYNEIKSFISSKHSFNNEEYLDYASLQVVDELKNTSSMFGVQKLQQIPAGTVRHDVNQFGDLVNYKQRVRGESFDIPTEKVIHTSHMNLEGDTHGFSPVIAMLSELDMLAGLKDLNAVNFDNAGVMNKLFILPDEGPDSANFNMVMETIEKYRSLENQHKDLVLTGDVEVKDLQGVNDMDFRELAEFISRILAMAWGVPASRVGTVIGQAQRGRGASLSHEGYYKRIQREQSKLQAELNKKLFEPFFNTRITLNNPSVREEVRRAERDLRKFEVAKRMITMRMWDLEKARRYLGVTQDEMPEDATLEDVREAAADIAGAENIMMSDNDLNADNAEEAARADIAEGARERDADTEQGI